MIQFLQFFLGFVILVTWLLVQRVDRQKEIKRAVNDVVEDVNRE